MTEAIPDDIKNDLGKACRLHERAVSDDAKCLEFSQLMSNLLVRMEDAGCLRIADKVMTVLISCSPKEGAHCDKAACVAEKMKNMETELH